MLDLYPCYKKDNFYYFFLSEPTYTKSFEIVSDFDCDDDLLRKFIDEFIPLFIKHESIDEKQKEIEGIILHFDTMKNLNHKNYELFIASMFHIHYQEQESTKDYFYPAAKYETKSSTVYIFTNFSTELWTAIEYMFFNTNLSSYKAPNSSNYLFRDIFC